MSKSICIAKKTGPAFPTLISQEQKTSETSAWDGFAKDENLHKLHNITNQEMQTLSQVTLMAEVRRSHDFLYILIAIRQALDQ
jgi:hypothetical protein